MRIKEVRLKNGLLQKEIAEILNVKRNTYAMWELEHDKIPLQKLIILADHFNVSIDYMLELSEKEKYKNQKNFNYDIYLKRIKEIRKKNKYSQVMIANKLNTTNSVISRYESGETFILTSFLREYSLIFNVSADYLLGRIDEPQFITKIK